ncbi:FemAB family XrtA/PEP-CTERM system-associated protein [Cellvibrio sp. pealriver]|uniref:FemAB family XrtA/PEP-CTERM system-associated protein n=1 Tax=Cellvibrio sp. pealriver TaxID=1622269 RepID=UPI00066FFD5C|nr:FemAB family XrtA/PEP-CTERM system-associated protein [Cellvibrio sp. pealriver]
MEQQLHELKSLKTQKGIISGKFKHLQKNTPEHTQQLALMKEISQKIAQLEADIKKAAEIKNAAPEITLAKPKSTHAFSLIDKEHNWNNEIRITLVEFDLVSDWAEFIRNNKTTLPSHNPAWAQVVKKTFGHQSFILCARSITGDLLGGIPFTVFSSPLFGKFGVSMPYLNYGGVVSEYNDVCMSLMQSLDGVRAQLGLQHIEIRSIHEGLGDNPSTKKASMLLRLPTDDESLDKTLGSKIRAQYKKADEFSPQVKIGKQELLDDFYRVFSENMRDLGTPVYAKTWFANILNHDDLDANIIIVYINKKPVSCGFLVSYGTLMEIPWASTLKSANKYNTNMWMYRKILSFAIQKGCVYFDFGRSTLDAGTYKFKKQWGAEPCQHYWYCVLPPNTPRPEMNPDNPKLKIFVALWKWLPLWAANLLGPHIIKGIP